MCVEKINPFCSILLQFLQSRAINDNFFAVFAWVVCPRAQILKLAKEN